MSATMANKRFVCVEAVSEAEKILMNHERKTATNFVISKQEKMFGKEMGPIHLNSRILWEGISHPNRIGQKLEFDGMPFMLVGRRILDCHLGADRHIVSKAKYRLKREADEVPCKKRRIVDRGSKKFGCPAKIQMWEVLKFSDYKVSADERSERLKQSKKLKEDLSQDADKVKYERKIYIDLTKAGCHRNHPVGKESERTPTLHKILIRFIHAQVYGGIESPDELGRRVEKFVKKFMCRDMEKQPSTTNRRYYPTETDLRNHIYSTKKRIGSMKVSEIAYLERINELIEKELKLVPISNMDNDEVSHNSLNQLGVRNVYPEGLAPVTVHLQVEEETIQVMLSECRELLTAVQDRLTKTQDPNIIMSALTKLRDLAKTMPTELDSENSEKHMRSRPHESKISLLEKELRKFPSTLKRKLRNHVDNTELSDSDMEVDCDVLDLNDGADVEVIDSSSSHDHVQG